jgi:putative intracellular protease/amidase
MTEPESTRTLGAVLYKNFELLDLFGPLEMFGNVVPGITIVTVAEQPGPVPSVQGPQTVAEYGFRECPRLDLILLPGGLGAIEQLHNAALFAFLKDRSGRKIPSPTPFTGFSIKAGGRNG